MNKSRKSAFTLVEVIFAAAILGMVLTGMMACLSRCLSVMRVSKQYHESLTVLGMAEVEHPLRLDKEIDELEVFDDGNIVEGYLFNRTIEAEEDENGEEDGLYIIRSKVSWQYHGKENYHEVVQYLYHPDAEK